MLVELYGIKKSFYSDEGRLEILKGVDFSLEQGEIVTIVGESGTGKSTLLHIASGLLSPDEGEIYWDGERIDHLSSPQKDKKRRGFMGFIFQMPMLMEELNVMENILISTMIAQKNISRTKITSLLNMVGLKGKEKQNPSTLSVGEAQRVAVLRAIAFEPKVVLADEPTASLDPENTLRMAGLIKELNEKMGTAFLIVTHNLEFAKEVSHRLLRLRDGTLEESDLKNETRKITS